MRAFASLCLTASLLTAPAFAQVAKSDSAPAKTTASPILDASKQQTLTLDEPKGGASWVNKLSMKKSAESQVTPLAPVPTDQLALSFRTGAKWNLTLDFTQRGENSLLPREELAAGAYYQVTPNLRVGGGVTLNGDNLKSAAEGWRDKRGEAGVRIESAFSF